MRNSIQRPTPAAAPRNRLTDTPLPRQAGIKNITPSIVTAGNSDMFENPPTDSISPLNTGSAPIPDLDQILGPVGHAFWISICILVLIFLIKYWSGKECQSKDFIELLLEIPVDALTILLTIIITTFCANGQMHFSHYLFIITLLVAIVSALLRRSALNAYYQQHKGKKTFGLLISELVVGIGWIIFVYNQIA